MDSNTVSIISLVSLDLPEEWFAAEWKKSFYNFLIGETLFIRSNNHPQETKKHDNHLLMEVWQRNQLLILSSFFYNWDLLCSCRESNHRDHLLFPCKSLASRIIFFLFDSPLDQLLKLQMHCTQKRFGENFLF